MIENFTYLPAVPELFLAVAGMALLMVGVFRGDGSTRLVTWLTVGAFVVTAVLILWGEAGTAFSGMFVQDGFGTFMKLLTLLGAALTAIIAIPYAEREQMARFEFPVLMLFATLGMLLMISANDLMSLYVGLELQSLSIYVLAAFRRDTVRSSEAGLKYFVLGALSSGLLLYGISMVYGFAGTTNFPQLAAIFTAGEAVPVGVLIGIVFVIAALAFKVSAVPFHMWTPDVYEGAPTPVTAFMAAAPKVAAMALFVRVLVGPFGDLAGQWQQVIQFVAAASMILGALAAIGQVNIKRLMAYSSIGHVGYALIGLAAGTEEGIFGLLVYMAIYVVMSVGTFAVILSMRQNGRMVETIDSVAGLSRTNPVLAALMAIFMFSMAGIPPLAGFFSKLYVFMAAIHAGLYTLAIIGVVSSVVGAYYYLRIVKIMYFDEAAEALDRPIGMGVGAVLAGTGIVTSLFILYPAALTTAAEAAAQTLFILNQ